MYLNVPFACFVCVCLFVLFDFLVCVYLSVLLACFFCDCFFVVCDCVCCVSVSLACVAYVLNLCVVGVWLLWLF